MKNQLKFLFSALVLILTANSCFALSAGKLDKLIKTSDLNNTATIAVSIKNTANGDCVYEQEAKKLLHPGSALKAFTLYPSINTLGDDYLFRTRLYKDNSENIYIKLGADPLLTTSQLKQLIQKLSESGNKQYKNLYIDDSILDKKEFAKGWMWDDDINPYTPKVSSYNLDGNVLKLNLYKNDQGEITAELKSDYPSSVISFIQSDAKTNMLEINRYNWNNPEVIEIYGNVTSEAPLNIPISSMRRYFIYNIDKILEDKKIVFTNTMYSSKLVPENAELIAENTNSIKNMLPLVLTDSSNLVSETLFKIAGGKKYNATGSDYLAQLMFKDFYNKNGISTDEIVIVDGCGVSRKNLLSADWMTTALNKIYTMKDFEKYKENMAQPGEGTLSERLYDLRGDVWLKTGSLSNISTLIGYVKSQDGNMYSVAIVIQNFNKPQKDIKSFEDKIIDIIYNR